MGTSRHCSSMGAGVAIAVVLVVAVVGGGIGFAIYTVCKRRRGPNYNTLDNSNLNGSPQSGTDAGGLGGYTPPSFVKSRVGAPAVASKDDFTLLRMLGKGAFAKVYQVRLRATGEIFAMKVLSKAGLAEQNEVEHTMGERSILLQVDHPFVVSMFYAFQSVSKLFFILEYVPGGELFTLLQKSKRFSLDQARLYAAEIVLALEYLHSLGIIYRDLKPENVLIDAHGHLRLTDFGLSKTGGGKTDTLCGTAEYLAPEVLRGQKYGRAVDWWSFGTLLYEMLLGLPPFYHKTDKTLMFKRIMRGNLIIPDKLSDPDARSLIAALLVVDPDARLGSGPSDASPIRAHPFFSPLDFVDVYNKFYTPSYVPRLATDDDVSHFEPQQDALLAYTPSVRTASVLADVNSAFDGFTYTSPSMLVDQDPDDDYGDYSRSGSADDLVEDRGKEEEDV